MGSEYAFVVSRQSKCTFISLKALYIYLERIYRIAMFKCASYRGVFKNLLQPLISQWYFKCLHFSIISPNNWELNFYHWNVFGRLRASASGHSKSMLLAKWQFLTLPIPISYKNSFFINYLWWLLLLAYLYLDFYFIK